MSEEADNYKAVVVRLNAAWRFFACSARIQFILQGRSGKRAGIARWESHSYCRTNQALRRLVREHAGDVDQVAAEILAGLPDRFDFYSATRST
ncbi:MAG: hypothetical protein WBD49_26535, partial [Bradyrhizobium sp.]